ncbi:rotamase-domain-containing protein, partial [Panus rudis PR-1116 ss-1]
TTYEIRMSSTRGIPYFHNTQTQVSTWEPPDDLSPDEITSLPGAHLLRGEGRPAQVRASHLLVKHRDSRRPSSWRESTITRTKEEAIEMLKGYQAEINNDPDKFVELVSKYSDDSSHAKGGDLGFFKPGQMQKAFEDVAFSLKVGEFSDIVSTDSGVHIILRTA